MEGHKADIQEAQELTGKQYGKLADWGERAALGGLGSLVVQQIILGCANHPSFCDRGRIGQRICIL